MAKRQVVCGSVMPEAPASILQLHRNVTVILDRAGVAVVPVVVEAHRQDFLSSRRSEMIGKD